MIKLKVVPLVFRVSLIVWLCSCSETTSESVTDMIRDTAPAVVAPVIDQDSLNRAQQCNIIYDTITSEKYRFHKSVMNCYTIPEEREFWFTGKGDTLETYLQPQHIGVFLQSLDSTEQGTYRLLTNKIVFLILEHDCRGLAIASRFKMTMKLSYFIWHVKHPMCKSTSSAHLIKNVEQMFATATPDESEFKNSIIDALKYPAEQ